jgi:uncharacterized repeat protein (TIGR03833 family)
MYLLKDFALSYANSRKRIPANQEAANRIGYWEKGGFVLESANCRRSCIQPGMTVDIVLKKDQPTGILTRGTVGRLLTNKSYHPRGIKVMLTDGQVGRVQKIISE